MKLTKLAIIAIALVVVSIGCDEMTVNLGEVQLLAETNADEGAVVVPADNPDREKILNFPWEDAAEEERMAYWELVVGLAVDVNVLDISNNNPEPLVVEVGVGEPIEIKNSDITDHTFNCPPEGDSITVSAGGSQDVVVTEVAGFRQGLVSYARDDKLTGIFYINTEQKFVSFTVVEFILPDGRKGPGLEGILVTPLEGERMTKKTNPDGRVFFRRNLPLTVLLEKDGHPVEVTISEDGQAVVLPSGQKNISFRVVEPLLPESGVFHPNWPRGFTQNGPGIEGVTVTPLEGSDEGVKWTDADGGVTFFGTPPLTVRLQKPGYVTIETVVIKEEIVFPNEWPPELDPVIEQLGLGELIDSGKLILSWGVEDTGAGFYDCLFIHISKHKDRDRASAVWTLIHEAMHARQAIESNARCALLIEDWPPSKEGQAWIAALEKDLAEHGPVHGFDGKWGDDDKPTSENPLENLASFYAEWRMGPASRKRDFNGKEELEKLYQLAPNRCQYLEDRFGPPPPR